MRTSIRGVARRAGWGVADQALSSLTNFAVGVFVARELGPTEFGAFSLAFATYLFALNASRGLATDPLVVRYSDAPALRWREGVAASTATATFVGVVVGAGCVIASGVLSDAASAAFLSLGVMLPGLMLQDAWRYAFFAAARGRDAFLNDLVWALALAPLIAVVTTTGQPHVQWYVLAWGGAAMLAALAGMLQARIVPQPSQVRVWYRMHHDLGVRYFSENISHSAATQLRLYGIGAIAGLAAVGAVRAAELLLGPVNLIIMGVGNLMAVPEAARLAKQDLRRFRTFIMRLGLLLSGAAVVFGVVVGVVMPNRVGLVLLNETWEPARALLLPTTAMVALLGVWASAWTGLRALGSARRGLRAQVVGASAFLVGGLLGATIDGATGAAWGSAAGNLVASVVWWYQLFAAIREYRPTEGAAVVDAPVPVAGS